jgi:hypothetical protein
MADPRDGLSYICRDPIPPCCSNPPTTTAVCALKKKAVAIDVVGRERNLPPEAIGFVNKFA